MQYLPKPDYLSFSFPTTHIVLVTNDGSELTSKVIYALESKGHKAVVLNVPNIENKFTGKNAVDLLSNSDEDIQKALGDVRQVYGEVGAFIHLHPHLEFQNGNFTQHFSKEREILKTTFFLAKHLQKPLNELGNKQRSVYMTVTRVDGKSGIAKRGNISVIAGGLNGLVKSLNLEWSPVFCRAVDIQPELSDNKIANQIIAEFHDANSTYVETCFSEEGRKTIVAKTSTAKANQEMPAIKTSVNSDTVFMVSGGARGVTATCVIEMAKEFKCKFILLGRSDDTYELPDFAKNESDETTLKRLIMNNLKEKGEKPSLAIVKKIFKNIIAKKEITDTLNQIETYGGAAVYLKADVTKPQTIKAALQSPKNIFGNANGIIHGAGRLADKFIQDKTHDDFTNVLTVKLDGLLSLLACVDLNKLDHLIMFSSVAGFYGNVGQTDYAIANEILSKAAHLFRTNHPKTKVSAINWGAWDSGMVSDALKKKFEELGVSLVNSEGGAAMMVNEFDEYYADQAQVVIGGTLPAAVSYISDDLRTHYIARKIGLAENPFLMHHVIQGNAVMPVVNAVGWMAQTCESYFPDFKVFKVENTRLFKGLVFDGKQKSEYIVELKEIEKSKDKIVFECTVLSEGAKLPTYHYKAKVTLVHKTSKVEIPKFQHQLSGTYKAKKGDTLYTDGSLFHGKYFQGIEQVLDFTKDQIVMTCKAPEVPVSDQGQFPVQSVNTFFTDIQYQGMVVWVQRFHEGAKSLPLQTDSAIIYKAIPFEKELFVNVKIEKDSEFKMTATCTVYDDKGEVYMLTEGATVTVSKELTW